MVGSAQESSARFRADIEGLRAVAALLVAVYHIWLGRVSGGVDVFFVIAGFLVTGTLLRQIQRTGAVHPGRFLGRLLVRLLPNALTVLAAVAVATIVLLPITRRAEVLREIAASAVYAENWMLISNSVDYLARDRGDSPVQHFWALSIQGQFYLIWLGLALLAVGVGAAFATRRRLALLVVVVTVVSFGASVVLTAADQPVAYFHTAARAWEFGVGGLVALGLVRLPGGPRWVRVLLGWLGLGVLLATGLVLPVASIFPGYAALLPVGAALLILLSRAEGPGTATGLLSLPPLVSLGGVAYAIYLWHWPLLVFTLQLRGVDRASLGDGLLVLGMSIVLAYASTQLIEKPVRAIRWERWGGWTAPIVGGIASLAVVASTSVLSVASVPRMQPVKGAVLAHWAEPDAAPDFAAPPEEEPTPGFLVADTDLPQVAKDGCQQAMRTPTVRRCIYGQEDAERTMMLVGGSQSAHWQPALEEIALQTGWRLEVMVKGGCRPGLNLVGPEHGIYRNAEIDGSCREWGAELLGILLEERPELVVSSTTVMLPEGETFPAYYEAFWRELADHDIQGLGLRGTPRASENRLECLMEHGADSDRCSMPRGEAYADVNPASALDEELPELTVADLSDWVCSPTDCPAVIENTIVYHDGYHMTATFAGALAQPLFREVPQVFLER